MRNQFFLFFLFIFLVLGFSLFNNTQEETKTQPKKKVTVKTKTVTKTTKKVKAIYRIEYRSVYAGIESPIVHKGEAYIPFDKYMDTGLNGLPVSGYFPPHSNMRFTLLSGKKATLRIPVLNRKTVIGLLVCGHNRTLMKVRVLKVNDTIFKVRARPVNTFLSR